MTTPTDQPAEEEIIERNDVLKLVVQKLASQALLFGIAGLVVLVGAWQLSNGSPILVLSVLFVFVVALAGYLFAEQKEKMKQGDPDTMKRVTNEKIEAVSNPTSDFNVELWTAPTPIDGARDIAVASKLKKGSYRTGQKIVVGFRSSQDCYLTLLNIGTSGKLTVLFPNASHADNFIEGGRDYRIPETDSDFEYELQGPTGVEKLKAVATLEKVPLLESAFASDGSLFRTVDASTGARDIGVLQKKIATVPTTEWAEAACEFTVI